MDILGECIVEVEKYEYKGKLPIYKKSQAFLEKETRQEPSVKNILAGSKEQFRLSFYEWAKQVKFQEV